MFFLPFCQFWDFVKNEGDKKRRMSMGIRRKINRSRDYRLYKIADWIYVLSVCSILNVYPEPSLFSHRSSWAFVKVKVALSLVVWVVPTTVPLSFLILKLAALPAVLVTGGWHHCSNPS